VAWKSTFSSLARPFRLPTHFNVLLSPVIAPHEHYVDYTTDRAQLYGALQSTRMNESNVYTTP